MTFRIVFQAHVKRTAGCLTSFVEPSHSPRSMKIDGYQSKAVTLHPGTSNLAGDCNGDNDHGVGKATTDRTTHQRHALGKLIKVAEPFASKHVANRQL